MYIKTKCDPKLVIKSHALLNNINNNKEALFIHFRSAVVPPAVVGFSSVCQPAVVSCSCLDCVLAGLVAFGSSSPAAVAGTLVLAWTLREDSL